MRFLISLYTNERKTVAMNSIKIQGYKSFKNLSLDLRPINVLIGANGAGKSNFLSFFEFLNRLYEQKLKEYAALNGGSEVFFHNGSKETEKISSTITFDADQYGFDLSHDGEKFFFINEELWTENMDIFHDINSYGYESKVKDYLLENRDIKDYFVDIKKYHFHDTGNRSPFVRESHIENDIFFLYEKGENLAAFLYNIRKEHPMVYNLIRKVIQSIAPYFSDFYFNVSQNNTVRLLWQDKFSSTIYGPTGFSDGTIRFIALTTLFMQPNLPEVIIIDEPELGLHPLAIQKLAGMIKSAAAKGTQVITATQSADLMGQFNPEDVITVNQANGETTMTRLSETDLSQWLNDYSLGDLWKQNIIKGGQPQ